MGTLLRTNGTSETVVPANTYWTLDEMYKLTNCDMIQMIELPDGRMLILDEESKCRPVLPEINREATRLGRIAGIAPNDMILGDVLVADPGELEE